MKIFIISIVLLLSLFTVACTNQTEPTQTIEREPIRQQAGLADGVIEANNLFSIDLYNEYKSKDENLFFSPYSISSALAMTYEGAKGQTAEEMQATLHLPNDKEKIRSDFKIINIELNPGSGIDVESLQNKIEKYYQLNTANALWAQEDYPFKEDYFDLISSYYNGKVTNLNFKTDTENSRVTINKWVEHKTNDKIKNLIPKGILTPNTRLVLTNAIYFKANWTSKFDAEDTRDGEFKLSSGESTTAKMMHQTDYFNYGETKDLQILEMDYMGYTSYLSEKAIYKKDISMLIILPKDNDLTSIENSISTTNLANWKKNMDAKEVIVTLPKFKFETKYFMADDLKQMGMPTAFDSSLADFTGMWNRQSDENLYISQVIHQTFIEVTEAGTEAAAATAVLGMATSAGPGEPQPEPKIFTADHPFIFIIQQKDSGNILFMGRMSNPTK